MPLDYNNLHLLLTMDEAAEVFRCSKGRLRQVMKERPGWLTPVSQVHSRKLLFRRDDVLAASGLAVPSAGAEPDWQALARERAQQAAVERSESYARERLAYAERVKSHPPTWRATQLCWGSKKVRCESDDGDQTFRVWLFFQKNYRPEGWPTRIDLPLTEPGAMIRLDTDEQRDAVWADIETILAKHAPLWEAMKAERRRAKTGATA